MKKLTFSINEILISILLFSTLSAQGMEEDYKEFALQAQEYNQRDCWLIKLPHEIISQCFKKNVNRVKSLENNITSYINLCFTCKHFNKLLTFATILKTSEKYTLETKNELLSNLIKIMTDHNYTKVRLPIRILVCAGADTSTLSYLKSSCEKLKAQDALNRSHRRATHAMTNISISNTVIDITRKLFAKVISENDAPLLATLLKYYASSTAKGINQLPAFFSAKTVTIVQMLIDKGINVCANGDATNVLWHVIDDAYPSELMELYVRHGVDTRQINPNDHSCLLHYLAKQPYSSPSINTDNFLAKVRLLLNNFHGAIIFMINKKDKDSQTPMDIAQQYLRNPQKYYWAAQTADPLITLLKEYGCLTTQEIAQRNAQKEVMPNNEDGPCIIS